MGPPVGPGANTNDATAPSAFAGMKGEEKVKVEGDTRAGVTGDVDPSTTAAAAEAAAAAAVVHAVGMEMDAADAAEAGHTKGAGNGPVRASAGMTVAVMKEAEAKPDTSASSPSSFSSSSFSSSSSSSTSTAAEMAGAAGGIHASGRNAVSAQLAREKAEASGAGKKRRGGRRQRRPFMTIMKDLPELTDEERVALGRYIVEGRRAPTLLCQRTSGGGSSSTSTSRSSSTEERKQSEELKFKREGAGTGEKEDAFLSVPLKALEREFWRIVETQEDHVVVDYANDLNTDKTGCVRLAVARRAALRCLPAAPLLKTCATHYICILLFHSFAQTIIYTPPSTALASNARKIRLLATLRTGSSARVRQRSALPSAWRVRAR